MGRPRSENAKVPVSLRLDPDVAAYWRGLPEWRREMNDCLRAAMPSVTPPVALQAIVKETLASVSKDLMAPPAPMPVSKKGSPKLVIRKPARGFHWSGSGEEF